MDYKFITGMRVYVYSFRLNINKLKEDMYGYIEYAEDILEEDWLSDNEYEYQNLSIVLDNGKSINVNGNASFFSYKAIPVKELNKIIKKQELIIQ